MSQEIYFVAQIKELEIGLKNVEVERITHPESEEFRNAVNGGIVGMIIGLLYGAATLMVIGAAFIPGIFGASLILGYSALGGAMFGAIIGSTGVFARRRLQH